MTPTKPSDGGFQRLSRLTLALLQDTGWYAVEFTESAFLGWGRNAGCSFPQSTSTNYMISKPGQPYFCNTGSSIGNNVLKCSYNGYTRGYCIKSQFGFVGMVTSPSAVGIVGSQAVSEPTCISSYYTNSGSGEGAIKVSRAYVLCAITHVNLLTSYVILITVGLLFPDAQRRSILWVSRPLDGPLAPPHAVPRSPCRWLLLSHFPMAWS